MTTFKQKPTLRFPEFNDEWINCILGEIAAFSKGKGISKADITDGGELECIRYGELYTLYTETIDVIKSRTNLSENGLVMSEVNDVIVPASGETQLDIAKVSCVLKKGVALGGDLNIIKSRVNGVYLSYYLNYHRKFEIASLAQGNSVVHLYAAQLKTLTLNLPELLEQNKIADFLTSIDNKIKQLSKKKELLYQYKKGAMQQIFNQEIRFNDDNCRKYPDWQYKKFSQICSRRTEKYNPFKVTSSIRCLEMEHLETGSGRLLGYIDGENSSSIKNRFFKNDVLFGKLRPYLRKFWLSTFDGACSSEIWVLKSLEGISSNFLFSLIQTSGFMDLANISSGSKMPRSDWGVVSSGEFRIPCLEEQTKIANFLSAIDDKINLVNQQMEKTKEYKKGLLQQMFV